jgi:antitoxin VapB
MPDQSNHSERHVRLFRNGRNQAVRIPREFELPGDEAVLYRDGNRLILEPVGTPALLDLLGSWAAIATNWPEPDDPVPGPVALED